MTRQASVTIRGTGMKRFIAVCAAVAVLAGCASAKWTKPNGDNSQFEQDKAQCVYEVDLNTQNAPFNPFAKRGLIEECLRTRGYVSK
jgi:hypothetical protein